MNYKVELRRLDICTTNKLLVTSVCLMVYMLFHLWCGRRLLIPNQLQSLTYTCLSPLRIIQTTLTHACFSNRGKSYAIEFSTHTRSSTQTYLFYYQKQIHNSCDAILFIKSNSRNIYRINNFTLCTKFLFIGHPLLLHIACIPFSVLTR